MTSDLGSRLTDAYRRQLTVIRGGLSQNLTSQFAALQGTVPNDAQAEAFVEQVLPLVLGAQSAGVNMTSAYLDAFAVAETGDSQFDGIDVEDFVGSAARGGVDLTQVYLRPFIGLWIDLAQNRPYQQAWSAAQALLDGTGVTDVQLAVRNAGGALLRSDGRVRGWWRRPSGRACNFCEMVSTRLYYRDDLMPIHPHCGCTVEPDYESDEEPVSPDTRHTEEYGPMMGEFYRDAA